MPCYHPQIVYRSRLGKNENGSWPVVFNVRDGFSDMQLVIPCGQCIGCRLEYSRQWAVRCVKELRDHTFAEFVTLTYDEDQLPDDMSLHPEDMTNFLKRLRHWCDPIKIRYLQCGEYGETTNRPHHHMIIFGFKFPDAERLYLDGDFEYRYSEIADGLWQKGFCTLTDVSFETCAYVARYVLKKQLEDVDSGLVKPYITMSRRPGIGMNYFEKFKDEIYQTDTVVIRGIECKPPKAFDAAYRAIDPKAMSRIAGRRLSKARMDSLERMEGRERFTIAKQNTKGKRNENRNV